MFNNCLLPNLQLLVFLQVQKWYPVALEAPKRQNLLHFEMRGCFGRKMFELERNIGIMILQLVSVFAG